MIVLKWIALIVRILPMLEDVYEQIIAIIAVIRTERKDWKPGDGDLKRLDAVEFLKRFTAYTNKNQKTLNNIVNSAWNFVFHKEK
jgi:hypothetical protein